MMGFFFIALLSLILKVYWTPPVGVATCGKLCVKKGAVFCIKTALQFTEGFLTIGVVISRRNRTRKSPINLGSNGVIDCDTYSTLF